MERFKPLLMTLNPKLHSDNASRGLRAVAQDGRSSGLSSSDPKWLQALHSVLRGQLWMEDSRYLDRRAALWSTDRQKEDRTARVEALDELFQGFGESYRRYQDIQCPVYDLYGLECAAYLLVRV